MTEHWYSLPMRVTIADCPRCREAHAVVFYGLIEPIDDYTDWGMCPNSSELLLMRIVTDCTLPLRDDEVVA